jgi:hypothetical protein
MDSAQSAIAWAGGAIWIETTMTPKELQIVREYIDAKLDHDAHKAVLDHQSCYHGHDEYRDLKAEERLEAAGKAFDKLTADPYEKLVEALKVNLADPSNVTWKQVLALIPR